MHTTGPVCPTAPDRAAGAHNAEHEVDAAITRLREQTISLLGHLTRAPAGSHQLARAGAIDTLQQISNQLGALQARVHENPTSP